MPTQGFGQSLRFVLAGCALILPAACGGSQAVGEAGLDQYPVVTDPPPAYSETVTDPSGATWSRPSKPEEYEIRPSSTCERQPYKSASGGGLVVVPPRPGLSAKSVSAKTVEVSWWFNSVPPDCRPAGLLLSIVANDAPHAAPLTVTVPFTGEKGVGTVRYPDSLPPPDVALASAVMADGRSSRTAKVLIRD